jgi:fatty acid-binding protein DegV
LSARGESIEIDSDVDEKAGITTWLGASVSVSGRKTVVYAIVRGKGKALKYLQQVFKNEINEGLLVLTTRENAWADQTITEDYVAKFLEFP